jgi:1-acyl-sn-glycerol-3-phosphate acyltransferase
MGLRERAQISLRGGAIGAVTATLLSGLIAEERVRGASAPRRDAWLRRWARGVLGAVGAELVVAPESWSPSPGDAPAGGRLVVANHRSMLDIPVLLGRFGGAILAKKEMEAWPVMGAVATRVGTLYVDRANPTAGAAAIRAVSDALAAGRTVGVFPEGTTFKGDAVRPFMPGAFVAIARTEGEVVPVGLAYEDPGAEYFAESFGAHATRLLTAGRLRVGVAVGRPFSVAGMTSKAASRRAQDEVQSLVLRARTVL